MTHFLLILILLVASTAESATFDPSFNFRTMETAHFSVHYHQGIESLAKRAALIAEEVHTKLTPLLGWQTEEKTNLILADNSDNANGMATTLPWNAIYLQTAPPPIISTLGAYDDWLRILIIHEYAHILTSDPVRGYSLVMRRIFGKTYPTGDILSLVTFLATAPPNVMMPRWWHEGMATWSETELSSAGRGRSSFYEMIFRTAVADDNLPTLDIINGDVPFWPGGNLPYIFGSSLIQHIAATYGKLSPGAISLQQSGRFPYFINGTPEEQLGNRDYVELYQEMLVKMIQEQKSRLAKLETTPVTKLRKIGKESAWETFPRLSPDGKRLAFSRDDRHSRPAIVISDLDGNESDSFEADGSISWSPSGESLYFSKAEFINNLNFYNDLYRYDLEKKKIHRMSFGLRAAEPDISPDGNTIAAIISGQGSQNLALLDVANLKSKGSNTSPLMLTSYQEQGVASPRWSPDGKSIIFTVKDNSGNSHLNLYNFDTGRVRTLFSGRSLIATPSWSRDGKQVIYSTDANGVFNLFVWSLQDNSNTQITNVKSGVFSPQISDDGRMIVVSHYGSTGFSVALMENPEGSFNLSPSPSILGGRYPVDPKQTGLTISDPAATEDVTPNPYSPVKTLLPRFWLPAMISDGLEGTATGVMTAGQDILGYHSFTATAYYGSFFHKTYLNAIYRYDRLTPSFSLQGYQLPATYGNFLGKGDYTELEKGLICQVSLPFKKLLSELSLVAGYRLKEQQALTPLVNGRFNGIQLFQGRNDSYFTGIDYTNTEKYPWSISSETGRTISGRLNYFGRASGSELETRTYTLAWEEFFHLPQHQTIMLRVNGGMSDGEKSPQQAFQLGGLTTVLNPFGLRGYESRFAKGDYITTGTMEYRFPAWYFLRGVNTKPVFLDRLHGAVFLDAGEVWDRDRSFRANSIKTGAGTEVRLDLTLGYWLKITPSIGYAHGFDRDGVDQLYFNISTNL